MKKIISLAVMSSMLFLSGCTATDSTLQEVPKKVTQRMETYTIVSIRPPKRMYVVLKDSNNELHRKYVSKRCSRWKEVVIDSKVELNTRHYSVDGKLHKEIEVSTICPRG